MNHHKTSQHGKVREPTVHCNFCHFGAIDHKSWLLHVNKHHQRQILPKWISCTVCKLLLPDEQSLDRHMNSSSGHREKKTSHPCLFCSKVFATTYRLYTHSNDHHRKQLEDQWLPCSACKSYLPDESSLKNHTIHAHQRPFKAPKPITCTFCPEICFTKHSFIQHANSSHFLNISESKWKICSKCHSYFPDRNSLKEHKHKDFLDAHKENMGRDMKCPFCQMNFKTLELMCAHAKQRHPLLIPSTWICCQLCQYSFPSVPIFAMHNQQTHKFFTCFECLRKFSAESMLLTHAKQKHGLASVDDWLQSVENNLEVKKYIAPQNSDAFENCLKLKRSDARVMDVQVSLSTDIISSWHRCEECSCYLQSRQLLRKHCLLHQSVVSHQVINRQCPIFFIFS